MSLLLISQHTAHGGNAIQTMQRQLDAIQTMQRQLDDISSAVCCEINSKLSGKAETLHCLFSEAKTSTTNPQAKLRGCSNSAQMLYKFPCKVCRRREKYLWKSM